jgi:DNA polymerase sigma
MDICINERLGLKNSILLSRYLDTYGHTNDDLRALASAVKTWAKSHDLVGADRAKFSSYAFVVMVVSFLQVSLSIFA